MAAAWLFATVLAVAVAAVWKMWRLFRQVVWRPYVVTKRLRREGVRCPPYSFVSGSMKEVKRLQEEASRLVLPPRSNDITRRVLPHFHAWSRQYGEPFFYWAGTQPRVYISDPELAKEILSKFELYVKPEPRHAVKMLVGEGVALANGIDWVRRRRILNPAFSVDKLKVMIKAITKCTESILHEWRNQAMAAKNQVLTLEMNDEFQKLTADIIARTAFGSSYVQGKEAFMGQKRLQKYCADSLLSAFVPGRYLPTPSNIQLWKLDWKVKNSLRNIVKSRLESCESTSCDDKSSYGDDLLGLLMASSEKSGNKGAGPKLDLDEIIEECKTFFFAGHETSSNLLTWTIFLLSIHQDWQSKVRDEVQKECAAGIHTADTLTRLKLVNMVLMEALRLYCPIPELIREASEDIELGNFSIPKGTCVIIPITKIHTSREYWGEDALDFNPLRFADGAAKAVKHHHHPSAFLPFALGPRTCIGQNFAMLESKTVLALLLQSFSFTLSVDYKHTPVSYISMQPQFGLPVLLHPLCM
ncbi:unnamed protein product [Linum trigynum]|uniref:Cytochrome P450 n=1 Tax=Linum trigynum TaxID=586398 RepID=A0AAV2FMB6_9ROSI